MKKQNNINLQDIPIQLIENNPGIDFNKFKRKYGENKAAMKESFYIDQLAIQINRDGLVNPPRVKKEGKVYVVKAGHHRTQAMKNLGWETITCEVL